MILLLGGSGYVGQEFKKWLEARKIDFIAPGSKFVDASNLQSLRKFLAQDVVSDSLEFIINVAGYTGKPNVDACESNRTETMLGNVTIPLNIAIAATERKIPWGHVSSGCIYSGALYNRSIFKKDQPPTEIDNNELAMIANNNLFFKRYSESLTGFTEGMDPNFTFKTHSSFYSGTKALGEEVLKPFLSNGYIWRLRIPFNSEANPRNYLTKLLMYPKLYNNINSVSHLGDFVNACIDSYLMEIPYGIYNVVNPGFVSTKQVASLITAHLKKDFSPNWWANDEEFYRLGAKTPRSNCILSVDKLLAAGVKMRSVDEALIDSIKSYK